MNKAQRFVSKEIRHLEVDKSYPPNRAVGAAYAIAREKGFKVPRR